MIPGEYLISSKPIAINQGLNTKVITVRNTGDRPIQIGSHFHFFEVNRYLLFDRKQAFGYRLDIASGTAIRFEPDEEKEVHLVAVGGKRRLIGFNGLTDTQVNETETENCLSKAKQRKFL